MVSDVAEKEGYMYDGAGNGTPQLTLFRAR